MFGNITDALRRIKGDVAQALSYAHNKKDAKGRPLGIVHRDVSATNVMVAATGEVRAGDAKGRHTTSSRQLHRLPGGGTLIDTADVYAGGTSEQIIGRWLADRPADVTDPVAACFDENGGMYVAEMDRGSPADKAGSVSPNSISISSASSTAGFTCF